MNFKEDLGRGFVVIFFVGMFGIGSVPFIFNKTMSNLEKNTQIIQNTESKETVASEDDSYDIAEEENIKSLDDLVKREMQKKPIASDFSLKTDSSMFSYLNDNLLNDGKLLTSESLSDYSIKVKKIKKMQRMALYISNTYKQPLKNAEIIVYNSYVEAEKKNLDPTLVLSLIDVESTFNQYSKSGAGAVGLTQIIPSIHKNKIAKLEHKDIWSIPGNIELGTQILREYIDISRGNVADALQRYNGSLGDESFSYSHKVLNKMHSLSRI